MRDLRRNLQRVWYARPGGWTELLDAEGNRTGQRVPRLVDRDALFLCVSAARGDAELTLFGQQLLYDRVMTTADPHCPIDEKCVLWVERSPLDGPYDYVVVQRAAWKNSTAYAIRRVDVGETNDPGEADPGGDQGSDPGAGEIQDVVPGEDGGAE